MQNIPGTEYIYKIKEGTYQIRKKKDGKVITYGTAHDLNEAIEIRDYCQDHNWEKKYPSDARRLKFSEDYEIVNRIMVERNIKTKTRETYIQTIDHYTEMINQSLTSLLKLYAAEEEELPWKKRTLKNHLIEYRSYLYTNYLQHTARIYFGKILTIFRHLEIELSYLPNQSNKNVNELPPITYDDLLDKNELEEAYGVANNVMKAIILFCVSSGCARRETLNLTVQDYLEANNVRVTKGKSVKSLLLKVDPNTIPTFKLLRQKTNKYYFTYCSPQANNEILEYLIDRDNLKLDSPLFDVNLYYWNTYFSQINEELELGTARKYNRFRSHMIRKYHASTLYNHGMSMDDIDTLQGRGKDSTHRAYFMEDPLLLKKKYQEHMDCLLLEV